MRKQKPFEDFKADLAEAMKEASTNITYYIDEVAKDVANAFKGINIMVASIRKSGGDIRIYAYTEVESYLEVRDSVPVPLIRLLEQELECEGPTVDDRYHPENNKRIVILTAMIAAYYDNGGMKYPFNYNAKKA